MKTHQPDRNQARAGLRRIARLTLFSIALPLTSFSESTAEAPKPSVSNSTEDRAALYAQALESLNGTGVPKDEARAFELFQRAADLGHADALGSVGYFYSVGKVVEKDDVKARHYFELAAAQESKEALVNLGRFLLAGRGGVKEPGRGVACIEKVAARGSVAASLMLGDIFYWGEHADGIPDYPRAFTVLKPLADTGNASAQNILGVMLRDERIAGLKPESARDWFLKAAQQGHGKACSNLGQWGFDSTDRALRIESLQWLLVARHLKEVTAIYFLDDHLTRIKPDELSAAQPKADEIIKSFAGK